MRKRFKLKKIKNSTYLREKKLKEEKTDTFMQAINWKVMTLYC